MKHTTVRSKTPAVVVALLTASILLAACGPSGAADDSDGGEIVIACTSCADDPSDPFLQYRHQLAVAFNEEHAGRYRIEILPNVVGSGEELKQAYQRLAVADDLPDLFVHTSAELAEYDATADLMDFGPLLEENAGFRDSFYDGIFTSLTTSDGKVLGIPEQRDVVGVYYNTALLETAGISQAPATWKDFTAMAEAVKAAGSIPMAADGLFVTLVWLSHLIGTQDGGTDYLNSDAVGDGGFADEPLWVQAVEYLRDLHGDGLVNEDAFTGDFQRASVPFLTGEAAAITNGPWYIGDLKGNGATPGLADSVQYVPAPGDGVVVFGGDAAWASDADDPETQEAVGAFIRFAYSFEEQVSRTLATGSYGPVKGEFSDEQRAQLEPLAVGLVEASADVVNSYPYIGALLPASFQEAWQNYWPAYVQGDMDTPTFLTRLSDSVES